MSDCYECSAQKQRKKDKKKKKTAQDNAKISRQRKKESDK